MAPNYRQEMPPSGGYGPIEWARVIPKKRFSGYTMFGMYVGFCSAAWALLAYERSWRRKDTLEMNDGRVALEPFIFAERERMVLKQLRANRDEENELMKDVPGWETGTWYGKPVYHGMAKRFPIVSTQEYYAHARKADMYDRVYEKRKH